MEVGLTITVGTVLAAAGVLAYLHARDAAGDAIARQKVADLQLMVEDHYTRYSSFPTVAALRDIWATTRTDGMKSPWGGPVVNPQNQPIEGFDDPSKLVPANPARTVGSASEEYGAGSRFNNLIYHRYQVPGAPPEPPWQVWDAGAKGYVSVSGYSVSINKKGRTFFFISSGRSVQ